MHGNACATVRQAPDTVQLIIAWEILGRNARLKKTVTQRGIPSPRINAARTQVSYLANGNGCNIQMIVLQPTAVSFYRRVIGDSYIGASCRYPCGQQPQVVAELAGKRRGSVVVCPMRQRQIMFGIENINVNHQAQRQASFFTKLSISCCIRYCPFHLTVMLTLDFMPVAGSFTVRVITPGVLPA